MSRDTQIPPTCLATCTCTYTPPDQPDCHDVSCMCAKQGGTVNEPEGDKYSLSHTFKLRQ